MNAAQSSIANGSKSFYFASLIFPRNLRADVWALYRWCRVCDDHVDLAKNEKDAALALIELERETCAAFKGENVRDEFTELKRITNKYGIPEKYPHELLAGLRMDTCPAEFTTLKDVENYSYHVAGVVGAMMASLMGVKRATAMPYAIALGNAMQLTNIARDVREDFLRGRVYLPHDWCFEVGVTRTALLEPENEMAVYQIVLRLLSRADELYCEGYKGLCYLPFRAACAVSVAAEIYSEIGRKIRRRGPHALRQRIIVSNRLKFWLAFRGMKRALFSRRWRSL